MGGEVVVIFLAVFFASLIVANEAGYLHKAVAKQKPSWVIEANNEVELQNLRKAQ